MTQVSRYPLDKDIQERIFEVFWQTMVDLRTQTEAKEFWNDLLTPTEKIMLAKRLSIAVLLIKGYNYLNIKDILKVSGGTISSVALWLNQGGQGYKRAVKKIINSEKWEDFWQKISDNLKELTDTKHKFLTSDRRYHKAKTEI